MSGLKIFMIACAGLCFAETRVNVIEFAAVDRLADEAKSTGSGKDSLSALELLAEGRAESVPEETKIRIGMRPTQVGWLTYKQLGVRLHAIQKLSETDAPEAMSYLSNLKEEEFAPNIGERTQLELAVQIALRSMQLSRVADRQQKVQFLEQLALDHGFPGQYWAVNELCDMGSLISYPVILQSMRNRNPDDQRRVSEEIGFCRQRIDVIRSNPDRVIALASVLNVNTEQQNGPVVRWAVAQLIKAGSSDAVAALDNFSKAIETVPSRSRGTSLRLLKDDIDTELRKRTKTE